MEEYIYLAGQFTQEGTPPNLQDVIHIGACFSVCIMVWLPTKKILDYRHLRIRLMGVSVPSLRRSTDLSGLYYRCVLFKRAFSFNGRVAT